MNQHIAENVAKILLDIKAVKLAPSTPFTYSSGIKSPIYTDCRMLISYPKERKIVVQYLVDAINETHIPVAVVAGTATAGIPHAAWVADVLNLPMVYVRSKPKDHGTGSLVEGVLLKDQETIVIEDLISTGGSSAKTVQAIRADGAKASHIFAITTYGMQKADEVFKNDAITLHVLTTFETIVAIAAKEGYIRLEEQTVILEWAADPAGWAKKQGFE
ncbi:MAG: orotate phosphoribosyltransferase [Candidatus Levybacteria bacterium]|nr:orotate phosphoribosyltransferase [Candidatus Levybacteria bacterium]